MLVVPVAGASDSGMGQGPGARAAAAPHADAPASRARSVTLGDEEARRRGVQKSVLEREHPPTFDVCVEMGSRDQWRVHADVAGAVDAILAGRQPVAEVRERDDSGRVWSWSDSGSTDFEDSDGSGDEATVAEAAPSSSSWQGDAGSGSTFPPDALRAARLGAALQAAGEVPAVAAALAQAASSSSSSSEPLRVYALGLEAEQVRGAAAALGLGARLALAARVQEADAVLVLRDHLKSSGWVRGAAKAAGVPVFALRGGEPPEVAQALRALLGADGPSRRGRAPPAGRGSGNSSGGLEVFGVPGGSFLGARARGAGAGGSAAEEADALEEARLAIESLVLANNQPVELLPRSTALIELQRQLAWQRYRLPVEVVGAADCRRLRVLPPNWAPAAAGAVPSGVAEPALEGGRTVEYW